MVIFKGGDHFRGRNVTVRPVRILGQDKVKHLTRQSGGPGWNSSLVQHHFSCPITCTYLINIRMNQSQKTFLFYVYTMQSWELSWKPELLQDCKGEMRTFIFLSSKNMDKSFNGQSVIQNISGLRQLHTENLILGPWSKRWRTWSEHDYKAFNHVIVSTIAISCFVCNYEHSRVHYRSLYMTMCQGSLVVMCFLMSCDLIQWFLNSLCSVDILMSNITY